VSGIPHLYFQGFDRVLRQAVECHFGMHDLCRADGRHQIREIEGIIGRNCAVIVDYPETAA